MGRLSEKSSSKLSLGELLGVWGRYRVGKGVGECKRVLYVRRLDDGHGFTGNCVSQIIKFYLKCAHAVMCQLCLNEVLKMKAHGQD